MFQEYVPAGTVPRTSVNARQYFLSRLVDPAEDMGYKQKEII